MAKAAGKKSKGQTKKKTAKKKPVRKKAAKRKVTGTAATPPMRNEAARLTRLPIGRVRR